MDRPGPGVDGARRRGASTPVTRLAEANRLDVAQDELAILVAPAEVRDDAVARPLRLFTEISPSRRAADEVLESAADLVRQETNLLTVRPLCAPQEDKSWV